MTAPDVRAILAEAAYEQWWDDSWEDTLPIEKAQMIAVAERQIAALEAAGLVICVRHTWEAAGPSGPTVYVPLSARPEEQEGSADG